MFINFTTWLILLAVLIIIEFITMGLTTIWFAGGALVAAILSALNVPVIIQIIAFIVVSFVLLVFTRPVAVKYFNKERQRTNAEALIGKKGVVISQIDNLRGIGQVRVDRQEWSARSLEDGRIIPEGTIVDVEYINGVKLIVSIDESVAEHVPNIVSDALLDPNYIDK